jgi:hypothetical protein
MRDGQFTALDQFNLLVAVVSLTLGAVRWVQSVGW